MKHHGKTQPDPRDPYKNPTNAGRDFPMWLGCRSTPWRFLLIPPIEMTGNLIMGPCIKTLRLMSENPIGNSYGNLDAHILIIHHWWTVWALKAVDHFGSGSCHEFHDWMIRASSQLLEILWHTQAVENPSWCSYYELFRKNPWTHQLGCFFSYSLLTLVQETWLVWSHALWCRSKDKLAWRQRMMLVPLGWQVP